MQVDATFNVATHAYDWPTELGTINPDVPRLARGRSGIDNLQPKIAEGPRGHGFQLRWGVELSIALKA